VREPKKEAAAPLLRRMEMRDLPSAMEVDAACLPRPWSERVWREELRSPFGLYLVLEEDLSAGMALGTGPGRDAREGREGRFIFGQIGVKHVLGELHVTTLAVRPERRRMGYARFLINAAIAAFPGARYVHLEVRPTNAPARALYESLGFVTTALRRRYYGDEDALLMTLDLGEGR
jgi:ribosomal-protein-alanine N-acetyltransferase